MADPAVLGFIGVTASRSSINSVFPEWARVLGLQPARLEPIDLPLGTTAGTYRAVVERIKEDPAFRGALVTTHKVNLLAATAHLFDELGPHAATLGEVSCLSKRGGLLIGHAKDPITSGRSIEDFLPPEHFRRTGGHVLCLGAGGAGLAIAVYLLTRSDPDDHPERIVIVNRSKARLEECERVLGQLKLLNRAKLIQNERPEVNDELMGLMPSGSLVVNATGLGKDRPGSPVSNDGIFPEGGAAWELNYRGELVFLQQAMLQAESRSLLVEDGWRYFVHGWSEVVAEVFGLDLDDEQLEQLSVEASRVRH